MHFNFGFTTTQVLWTLTFAALLVLLVVLLGRDRARRFPWFTVSIAAVAFRLLASRLLFGRMAPMPLTTVVLTLADLTAIIGVLVLVEIARRAFTGASRRSWVAGTLILVAVAAVVAGVWGAWPAWQTLTAGTPLAMLRLMQLAAQRIELLGDLLAAELGLLVVLLGRRFGAGWRSHTQQIMIGLSTAGLTELAMRIIWQEIAAHAVARTQMEYERIMGLQQKLYNANNVVYLAVLVWWVVCLWIDEPGTKTSGLALVAETQTAETPTAEAGTEETPAAE
jgi:hypothetical protein